MSDGLSPNDIKQLMNEVLDERDRIDHDVHKEDHEFITYLREKDKIRRERWEKITKTAIGAVVTVVMGKMFFVLYWIGDLVIEGLKNHK